ncbi:MAG: hypothetical protein HYR88_15910 [Verrucomicrobia bacterium]|nr:hypothetical protein [Verrucomicrobiota bacterium]MBI3870532.1 hypothetical protein [Verrucomicrobiota bacterium]
MSNDSKKPTTALAWASALDDIIKDGRIAVQSKDRKGLTDAVKALNKFIDALGDSDLWTHDLDHTAREALGQMTVDITVATNEDLASRTEELRQLGNALNATTADNEAQAANIRHDKLTQALVSALNAAKAAKELQAVVTANAEDGKIGDAAESLLKAISSFQDVITRA